MRRRGEHRREAGKVGKGWHGGSPGVGGSSQKRKREGTEEGRRNPWGRDDGLG